MFYFSYMLFQVFYLLTYNLQTIKCSTSTLEVSLNTRFTYTFNINFIYTILILYTQLLRNLASGFYTQLASTSLKYTTLNSN